MRANKDWKDVFKSEHRLLQSEKLQSESESKRQRDIFKRECRLERESTFLASKLI